MISPPPKENPVLAVLVLAVFPKSPPPVEGAEPNDGVVEVLAPKAGVVEVFEPNPPIVRQRVNRERVSSTRAPE